jgi:hypothetical protein
MRHDCVRPGDQHPITPPPRFARSQGFLSRQGPSPGSLSGIPTTNAEGVGFAVGPAPGRGEPAKRGQRTRRPPLAENQD